MDCLFCLLHHFGPQRNRQIIITTVVIRASIRKLYNYNYNKYLEGYVIMYQMIYLGQPYN